MTFIGIVLAGGASSRMGRDKALLAVDGERWLDCAVRVLRDAGASRVIVSGDRDGYDSVPDAMPNLGPVAGLAAALHAVGEGDVIVVPVDMPLLSPSLLVTLWRRLASRTAASFAGHPLPLALRNSSDTRRVVEAVLDGAPGARSLRRVLEALDACVVAVPPGTAMQLRNVNTPDDLWDVAP